MTEPTDRPRPGLSRPSATRPTAARTGDLHPRRRVLLALLLVVVIAGLAAVVVDDDSVDTVLGFVTGAAAVLLLGLLALRLLLGRAVRRHRDQEALDGLEPLRAARRDSGRA